MNAAEIKRWILEAPIWMDTGGEVRQSFRREEPTNIEKKPGPIPKGGISTDLRWGQSLATRGQPDIYKNHRTIQTKEGEKVLPIYHIYRRKTGEVGPSTELLTRVKSLDYPGAGNLLPHAAGYLKQVIDQMGIKATMVVPAPSSKPLAGRFAVEVAKLLGAKVVDLFDKAGEAKKMHGGSDAPRVSLRDTESAFDQDVIIVDDLTTKDKTVSQMAQQLWDTSMPRSVRAIVLIGRS